MLMKLFKYIQNLLFGKIPGVLQVEKGSCFPFKKKNQISHLEVREKKGMGNRKEFQIDLIGLS